MLPELLCFALIRDIVASEILSNVNITDKVNNCYKKSVTRTKTCCCKSSAITPKKFKSTMDQWHVYPKRIKIRDMRIFQYILETIPEVLHKASHLSGHFFFPEDFDDPDPSLELIINSGVRFDIFWRGAYIAQYCQKSRTICYHIGELQY